MSITTYLVATNYGLYATILFTSVCVFVTCAYLREVLIDYQRYRRAQHLTRNAAQFMGRLQANKVPFGMYLTRTAGKVPPEHIDAFDTLSQRDQQLLCLEYCKYVRLARRAS